MTEYDLDLSDPPSVDVEGLAIRRRQRREMRAAFLAEVAAAIASGRRVPSGDLYRASRYLNKLAKADEELVEAESNRVTT